MLSLHRRALLALAAALSIAPAAGAESCTIEEEPALPVVLWYILY